IVTTIKIKGLNQLCNSFQRQDTSADVVILMTETSPRIEELSADYSEAWRSAAANQDPRSISFKSCRSQQANCRTVDALIGLGLKDRQSPEGLAIEMIGDRLLGSTAVYAPPKRGLVSGVVMPVMNSEETTH
ncbi:MAG: hypothetical protein QF744_15960, partial [SAR202 cluster bacterium]|nr:hypothetical protein [SAR202 cluster bacterium]